MVTLKIPAASHGVSGRAVGVLWSEFKLDFVEIEAEGIDWDFSTAAAGLVGAYEDGLEFDFEKFVTRLAAFDTKESGFSNVLSIGCRLHELGRGFAHHGF